MLGSSRLSIAICLLSATAAMACETLDGAKSEALTSLTTPVSGAGVQLTTTFGMRFHPFFREMRMHEGIDWTAPPGTPVAAAGPGRVVTAARRGVHGNVVIIDHGAGWQTLYAHLSSFDVSTGDCVALGAVIGRTGSTGLSVGPKLHLELHHNGWPVDPLSLPMRAAQER